MTITIEDEHAGQRADVFLASHLGVSRSRSQSIIETATLNGAPLKAKAALKTGDVLEWPDAPDESTLPAPTVAVTEPMPPVVFEDDHVLIIEKPAGLIVHAGAGEPQSTLVDVLRAHGRQLSTVGPPERAGIVHRLDKETSGVMMVCKTDEAHWKIAADFEARRIGKKYLALVNGVPKPRGRIEAPLARHPVQRQKIAVVASGRNAVTEYEVLQSWQKFALVEVDLLTGRTHQIRVHFQYIGHPVVGDAVYGGAKRALEAAPNPEVRAAIEDLSGQALHAAKLEFTHPATGSVLRFESKLPPEMQRIVDELEKLP
jgi:23S rRNA pseudouridine1911/1915/1917 synthase